MSLGSAIDLSLRELLREVLREEIRAALRELLPAATAQVTTPPSAYLSTAEAADLARVRPETVRAWITAGRLRGHRAGREWRIRRDELEALMAVGVERAAEQVDLDGRARDILAGRIGRSEGR